MSVAARLQDTERSGAPLTFNAEQVIQLFAIACEDPQASGRPISQWTARELAQEMKRRGNALEHLGATCGAITRRSRVETTPDSLLVNPPPLDEQFEDKVNDITQVYQTAAARALQGERTVCTLISCT